MADKFAVVGFTNHKYNAPFGNPDWDLFGMNALHFDMPLDKFPFTGWFQVHRREMVEKGQGRKEHIEWLKSVRDMPILVLDKDEWPDVPCAVQLPMKDIEKLNPRLGAYHTSSVSWMVGYAILNGYKEIHVYGIDMASNTEYMFQRPACEAWLGYAEGLGIKTYTPPESDLFSCVAQYGSGDNSTFRIYLNGKVEAYMGRVNGITQNLSQIRGEKDRLDKDFNTKERKLLKELHHFEGMIIQCNDMLQNYTVPEGGGGSPYGIQTTDEALVVHKSDGGPPVPANRIQEAIEANG